MRKELIIASASTALVGGMAVYLGSLTLPQSASAHDENGCISTYATVTQPAINSTVGRVFTLSGQVTADDGVLSHAAIVVRIDGKTYIDPAGRANGGGLESFPVADASGNFSFSVDLNGNSVADDNADGLKPVADGLHTFQIGGYADGCVDPHDAVLALNVQTAAVSAAKVQVATTQKPLPSPIPTATASVAPVTASPAVAAESKEIDPMFLFILGALLGAAVLSLAEVSAIEYRKKHKLKGDVTKKKSTKAKKKK